MKPNKGAVPGKFPASADPTGGLWNINYFSEFDLTYSFHIPIPGSHWLTATWEDINSLVLFNFGERGFITQGQTSKESHRGGSLEVRSHKTSGKDPQ